MKNFDRDRLLRPEDRTPRPEDRSLRPEDAGAEPIPFETRNKAQAEAPQSLMDKHQIEELRGRWSTIQEGFIDEPRGAVKEADALVDAAIKQISTAFTDQRAQLEQQWSRGDQISTEDLRLAFQRYRAFFSRLLSI
jgi:hypothetical protein